MSDNNSSSNTLGVMFAFFVGGIIGAGLALLYAPSSGEETRKRLKEEMAGASNKVRQGYETAGDLVEEGMGKIKEAVEDKKNEVVAAYHAGKEIYQKERERLSK